ncbi:cytochrome c biogenesis protein ResB [Sulfurivirga sp.]|uniref:cytochrome c biogenesis protein ResB n=1 Tax=Sulfurivirga sp. TaxID=2614236 RepID=UPI0025E6383E|nr:cytochrome c biogenesis protein ResB [Sulfurivirga sp.]
MSGHFLHAVTSMRMAVTLLIMVALASVIGTVVPQSLPSTEYVIRFGPFWADVFNRLGVFDVYASGWFTTLLLFLVFSLTLCVSEHFSQWLRQRHRVDKAPAMPENARPFSCFMDRQTLQMWLESRGFRVLETENEKGVSMFAQKGSHRRLGYFLLHGGLLVILLGALIDTNPLLRLKLLTGQVVPTTFQTPPEKADPHSYLPPDSGAFRANLSLRPGEKSDRVWLATPSGYLIHLLPFVIAVDDFHIDYYANGMPKGYTTLVTLFSPEGVPLTRSEISVNKPLQWHGYTLYQSSFDDGGSQVWFTARQPGGLMLKNSHLRVGESINVLLGGQNWTLTLLDFQLHTVIHRAGGETINHGPRMIYRMTAPDGRRIWLENFLRPRTNRHGQSFHMLGVRHSPSEPFRTIALPLHKGDDRPFWTWLNRLSGISGNDQTSLLVQLFVLGGFDEIDRFVRKNIEETDRKNIKKFYISILLDKLDTTLKAINPTADARWRNDAIMAADALFAHRVPLWLQMTRFEQRLETGLIVARYPGKPLIWLGSLLLVAGIFLMLYTQPVKIWIHWTDLPDRPEMRMVIRCANPRQTDYWRQAVLGLCRGPENEHHGNRHE